MSKKIMTKFISCLSILALILQSCKDDSYLTTPPPASDNSFVEQFDTLSAALNQGWFIKNRSVPIGTGIWAQGPGNSAYSSQSTNDGCIFSDASCCHDANAFNGVISNWVISPLVDMQNGDRIIFYTKTTDGTWGDRLQVRLNIKNTGTECGRADNPGDFTNLILDINPQNASNDSTNIYGIPDPIYIYDPNNSFPTDWTRFEATIKDLSGPTLGRIAFRHYVPNGGDNGMGMNVYLDSVAYVSASRH